MMDAMQPYSPADVADDAAQKQDLDIEALANRLHEECEAAQKARSMVELRWLDDLRQYRGVYDPTTAQRLKKSKRSRVFYRMTTSKVNTMTARLMDLLFPSRSKNWSIDPTPDPLIPDDIIMDELAEEIAPAAAQLLQEKMAELSAQNIIPDPWAMQTLQMQAFQQAAAAANTPEARIRIAKERSQAMERVIDDQLKELRVRAI